LEQRPKKQIFRTPSGAMRQEFKVSGSLHRNDGPAVIERDARSGIVIREEYWERNRLHREDGPAIIERAARTGKISSEVFYTNGKQIKKIIKGYPTSP